MERLVGAVLQKVCKNWNSVTAFPSTAVILPPETALSPGTAFMPSAILGHEERKRSWDSAGIWGTAIVRYGILSELS